MFLTILYFYFLSMGVNLSQAKDFEESEKYLNIHWGLLGNSQCEEDRNKYYFYKLVNAFELNDKDGVIRYANHLLAGEYFSNSHTPMRYLDMAKIMKAEAETWKTWVDKNSPEGADDLGDISREMKKSKDRLAAGQAGPRTQEIQRDIEARLKRMIDKAEAAEAAAQSAAEEKAKKEVEEEAARRAARAARADGNFPNMPADDSSRSAREAGRGDVDRRKVKEIADVWGKLPEKERARALLELTRNMPVADRHVVEKYFRELQKRTK